MKNDRLVSITPKKFFSQIQNFRKSSTRKHTLYIGNKFLEFGNVASILKNHFLTYSNIGIFKKTDFSSFPNVLNDKKINFLTDLSLTFDKNIKIYVERKSLFRQTLTFKEYLNIQINNTKIIKNN